MPLECNTFDYVGAGKITTLALFCFTIFVNRMNPKRWLLVGKMPLHGMFIRLIGPLFLEAIVLLFVSNLIILSLMCNVCAC